MKESKEYEAVDHKEDTKEGPSESDKSASEDELENSTGKTRPLSFNKEKTKEQIRKHQARLSSFAELQLSRPLLRATQTLKYEAPTPIQAEAIPLILKGSDIMASAVTGSGKTAAYLLPIIERLLLRDKNGSPITRVLIIVPTRELAQQISSMLEKLCQYCEDITQAVVFGGSSMTNQAIAVRARPDILIATPGRLIDHLRNTVSFDIADVEILVLDEADRLLELGFADELKEIIRYTPTKRQTLLFSATLTGDVSKLAELSLSNPAKVATDPMFDVAQRLVQEFVRVRKTVSVLPPKQAEEEEVHRREAILLALCTTTAKSRVIIFFQHKRQAHQTCIAFGLLGLKCAELHGNLTQAKRLEALQRFKDGEVDFLFCTDLAARGIDISGIQCVINFELPKDLTTYVHRVGRTARAGKGGRAISLVGEERRSTMKELLKSSSSSNFQSRTVASSGVTKCYEKLKEVQQELKNILEQERIEREIRLAEMNVTKVENVVTHHDEIMARPKKTWFQSEYEKKSLKEQARQLYNGEVKGKEQKEAEEQEEDKEPKGKRERLGNRAKRRRVAARKREEKEIKVASRELRNSQKAGEISSLNESQKQLLIPSEVKQKVLAKKVKQQSRKNSPGVDEDGDPLIDLEKIKQRKAQAKISSDDAFENFVAKRSRKL